MKKGFILLLFICLSPALYQGNAEAAIGMPDKVQAATLVVPLMEKGISSGHNTLTVVDSMCLGDLTVHWQLWDINGNATPLKGNVTFNGSWVTDFGTILSGASPATLTQLTQDSFYRGFMTIDRVTAATDLLPIEAAYPFSPVNCLTGNTYYVRLLEGAANGIPMIHIEGGVPGTVTNFARGFYQTTDDREEIDNHARHFAYLVSHGQAFAGDSNNKTDYTVSRVYCQGNGESRIVVWAWAAADVDTNSPPSDHPEGGSFQYWQFDEAGSQVADTTVALNHIVNVINVPGDTNGQVWITNIPNNYNVYVMSFNSANNVANPALTWEAMFESLIMHQFLP